MHSHFCGGKNFKKYLRHGMAPQSHGSLQMGFTKQLNLLGFGEKQVAAVFWSGEMEDELRELGQLGFFW